MDYTAHKGFALTRRNREYYVTIPQARPVNLRDKEEYIFFGHQIECYAELVRLHPYRTTRYVLNSDIRKWAQANVKGSFAITDAVLFSSEDEAALFKLTFG